MLKNKKRYGVIFLFSHFLCSFAGAGLQAQSTGIKYVHFTRNNFLATNQVNCIMQDDKKFMWLGTSNGIQRFDGNRWLWLSQQKNSGTALPDNDVTSLFQDSRERLWVQTATGICLLNRANLAFTAVKVAWSPSHTTHAIRSVMALPDGHIWLTLESGGLYSYDEATRQFISDTIIPSSPRSIYQLAYDSTQHRYYLGTDSGIVIYDLTKKQYLDSGFNPQALTLFKLAAARESTVTLYLNSIGQLWFSSFNTHGCYDVKKDRLVFCDSTSKIWGVLGYTTDCSGTTWSYGATIAKMNLSAGKMEPLEQTPDQMYGISFQNAGCLFEDSDGTYWIATSNGVFLYNRFQQQFIQHVVKNYATNEVFKHINVWGFIELADGSIAALTTRGEGLYFFDKDLKQIPSRFNLARYGNAKSWVNIRCGLLDRENHLWVACERGPLLRLYPETGKIEAIGDTAFSKQAIYSMTQDNAGNLYLGTFRHGVVRRDAVTGKFSDIVAAPGDPKESGSVFSLVYDGNKYIWAATARSGLLKINTQTQRVEKSYGNEPGTNQPLPGSTVYTVIKSSFNQLMMATAGGIALMDIARESFRLLNTADGLPDNNVCALLKDSRHHIWFASDNGISAMKQEGFATSSYGLLEGLSNENFNVGAAFQLHDGRMLFGHNEGFTSFDPAVFKQPVDSSSVTITGVRLFDKYLNTDSILNDKEGMVLQFNQNFLTIEFSNMRVLDKNNSSYYYQLEGMDKAWIQCSGMPQAVYTYLPGGTYTFRVKCSTGNETGLQKITSFNIKIIPPLWKAWWFYVVGAVVVSGLVYLFLRSRYKQQLAAERGRSRIAKDLHDDMGSTLSTINILSEMAKTKIDTDIPTTKKFIHQISDNSNRIMESLDDIVWNIDTANDSMENTLSRMREFAGNLLEARDISYTFKEDERIKNIHLDLGRRHDFFMIFKEAVNNLAKYSRCATAKIDVSLQKNSLRLLITDDGRGFDRNMQFEGNGLTNMRHRAASLQGELNIESSISKGTTVALTIPL